MNRYEKTTIIHKAKKIDSDGNEIHVRRRSTMLYPTFLRSGNGTTIITQEGDRLDLLAKEFYGDQRYWFVIARANNLGKGSLVVPNGIPIVIPYENENGISSLLHDYNSRR
jgi:nucleoid-associated protein YgaU